MIIVEQSLNVALSIADRAVFMEKGRVRFEGSAPELAERDDLARAVFLGAREADVLAASWFSTQLVVNGAISGLAIGVLAMGLVLVYRSTRVINLAVGNMGVVGASLLAAARARVRHAGLAGAAGRRCWPARRSAPSSN